MTCYERGILTSAIVAWDKVIPAGQEIDALLANIDWTPTILAATGVSAPKDYIVDGENLLPLLKGDIDKIRDAVFLEITYTRGVVTRDWKYITTHFSKELQKTITPENRGEFNQEGLRITYDPIAGPVRSRYNIDEKYPGYFDDHQLYNMVADPAEQTNIFSREECNSKAAELQALLRQHQSDKPHRFGEFGGGN